ncbi:MAG: hypothetical protein CMK62_05720 [Pseudoalteromonadaceae bacterium]|nr:hypothetical protein [Pseudoalteromonadaceae bacterium]
MEGSVINGMGDRYITLIFIKQLVLRAQAPITQSNASKKLIQAHGGGVFIMDHQQVLDIVTVMDIIVLRVMKVA